MRATKQWQCVYCDDPIFPGEEMQIIEGDMYHFECAQEIEEEMLINYIEALENDVAKKSIYYHPY